MEKETIRGSDEASYSQVAQSDRQGKLIEKWRQQVFDGLMRNKRYELLIKDNLARYNKDTDKLKTELKQAKNEAALVRNKISVLENEAEFKETTN